MCESVAEPVNTCKARTDVVCEALKVVQLVRT